MFCSNKKTIESSIYPGIPTTIKTMGVNITTIIPIRVLIIQIGSTIILMVVEAQIYIYIYISSQSLQTAAPSYCSMIHLQRFQPLVGKDGAVNKILGHEVPFITHREKMVVDYAGNGEAPFPLAPFPKTGFATTPPKKKTTTQPYPMTS